MKQRDANTKQVLIKQKKLNEKLEKEISKRKDAEKKVENAERWGPQIFHLDVSLYFFLYEVTCRKGSAILLISEEFKRCISELYVSVSVCREKQKLENKLQSVEDRLTRLESLVAKIIDDKGKRDGEKNVPLVQGRRRKIDSQQTTPDLDNITRQGNTAQEEQIKDKYLIGNVGYKRKRVEPSDVSVLSKEKAVGTDAATIASTVLTHLFESKNISDNKLKTALDIIRSKSTGKEIESRQVAFSILHKTLMACARPALKEQLTPFLWSPGNWFPGDMLTPIETKMKSLTIDPYSLVSMWCDDRALYERYLQWTVLFSLGLDRIFPGHGISDSLADLSKNIVLNEYQGDTERERSIYSVTEVCCAATLAMVAYRTQGNVQAATSFVTDLILALGRGIDEESFLISYNGTLPVCLALEVWPTIIQTNLSHPCGQFLRALCHCILKKDCEAYPPGANIEACRFAAIFLSTCLEVFESKNTLERNDKSLRDEASPFQAFILAKQYHSA